MESQVRDAIYNYTLTGAGLNASNVFWNLAPQDTAADPVIVISIVTNPQFRDTLQNHDEQFLQFSIFGKNLQECETFEAVINGLWDKKTDALENLIDGNNKIAGLYRQHRDQLRDDKDYWHLLSRYKLELNSEPPNGFEIQELRQASLFPPSTVWPGTIWELDFDIWIPHWRKVPAKPNWITNYKIVDGSYLVIMCGYGDVEYMELVLSESAEFTFLTNNSYINEQFLDQTIFDNWSHINIRMDLTAQTVVFTWNNDSWTDTIGPGAQMSDWWNPDFNWLFMATQDNANQNRMATFRNTNGNPNNPLDPSQRARVRIKNLSGAWTPDFAQCFADEAKTIRRKVGEISNLIECQNGARISAEFYNGEFLQADNIQYLANGDFESGITYWSGQDNYPFGANLPTLESIYTIYPPISGWGALHGITSAVERFQGILNSHASTQAPTPWQRGHHYRIFWHVFIESNVNRKVGSTVRCRLWHDDNDVASYQSGDMNLVVGQWNRVSWSNLETKVPTQQTARTGLYLLVDHNGPIEFWIDDVRKNQVDGGVRLKRF